LGSGEEEYKDIIHGAETSFIMQERQTTIYEYEEEE
jgi:hypothetical protein